KYGDLYNLEATPAESTTYRLAKHDVEEFPNIITASEGNGTPYYTNSSHLPVGYTEDIFEALSIQDDLQTLYTSGTVFHAFLGEKLPDWQAAASLVKKIAENYKLPYYTMSPTYSVCSEHGYIAGEKYTCPTCGKETEVYSRITGYYRPVKNWNEGKAQEFKDRKLYNLEHSVLKPTAVNKARIAKTEACSPESSGNVMLFTTKTCGNCAIAMEVLKNAGIEYKIVDAEENKTLTKYYKVMQAPTLVVESDSGYRTVSNASEITKYAENFKILN
ncbi:MAG: anaerobic ribonucleoside-triphosphate reductase, partial [Oscillospiraceae bacterium]